MWHYFCPPLSSSNRATSSVWESYVWILSKTHVPCMCVTCKLPLFVLCDEISVTIAYSVGNKNTHIDNLITWYIYMAKWERNSCPWLPHARARWYGCIHANDTVQEQGSFLLLHEHARPLTCQRARDQWQRPCCIVIGTKLFTLKACLRLKW